MENLYVNISVSTVLLVIVILLANMDSSRLFLRAAHRKDNISVNGFYSFMSSSVFLK
jgi:hypothetical protein